MLRRSPSCVLDSSALEELSLSILPNFEEDSESLRSLIIGRCTKTWLEYDPSLSNHMFIHSFEPPRCRLFCIVMLKVFVRHGWLVSRMKIIMRQGRAGQGLNNGVWLVLLIDCGLSMTNRTKRRNRESNHMYKTWEVELELIYHLLISSQKINHLSGCKNTIFLQINRFKNTTAKIVWEVDHQWHDMSFALETILCSRISHYLLKRFIING